MELSKNLFEMFLCNAIVRKVFEEEMDLNYDLSSDYFQIIWTIWIDILLNNDIILNLARTQDFHQFLDLAWTQDFAQWNLKFWLTTIFLEKILESWLLFKNTNLESCLKGQNGSCSTLIICHLTLLFILPSPEGLC